MIAATRDGGDSWRVVFQGGRIAIDIATLVPGIAWVRIGRNRFLRTIDGGRNWTSLGRAAVRDMSFVSVRDGWAAPAKSEISERLLRTTDGGRTWRATPEPCGPITHFYGPTGWGRTTVDYLRDVWFVSEERGWVLCSGDGAAGSAPVAVFETHDGGVTWTKLEAEWEGQPGGLQFLPDGRGWRWPFDTGSVVRSPDGGTTWHRADAFGSGGFEISVWFASAEIGYAVGDGIVYQSKDGGRMWTPVENPPTAAPSD